MRGRAAAVAVVVAVTVSTAGLSVEASDGSFIAPDYPNDDCVLEVDVDSVTYRVGLAPQMVASTSGLPVSYEGTPAAQTLVVGEVDGTPAKSAIDAWLVNCGLTPQDWALYDDELAPPSNGNVGEATLDLTVIAGILPANVTLEVVNTGAGMARMLLLGAAACGLDYAIGPSNWSRDQLDTPEGGCIITNSYGTTEQNVITEPGDLYKDLVDELMAGLAQAGVIVLFSAGDEGSGGCMPDSIGREDELAPQWIASHPDVLSVGGTMWVDPSWEGSPVDSYAVDYVPGDRYVNAAWRAVDSGTDCTNTTLSGTGGGISSVYDLPAYQAGVTGVAPADRRDKRLVPDLAGLAGWPMWSVALSDVDVSPFSGTSAATPLTAVGLAHVNAALTAAGYAPVDNAGGAMDVHSIVYDPTFRSAFTDVTLGSNDLFSLGGWDAQAGYDLTTGWGVPDFTQLTNLLLARARGTGPAPPRYTFTFDTSNGGVCFVDTDVPAGAYTLPTSAVSCTPEGTELVGWRIPGQQRAFSDGGTVIASADQTFTAVARYPDVTVTYDANVGMDSACLAAGGDLTKLDERSLTVQTPRTGRLAQQAPCTPPGASLQAWTDQPTLGGAVQQSAGSYAPGADVPEVWGLDPDPVNSIRLYAVWSTTP